MIKVNALGDACPIPVVKTKNAIKELNGPGEVEILVDNEIAVQNLTKMARQKGYQITAQQVSENEYRVLMVTGQMGPGEGSSEKVPASGKEPGSAGKPVSGAESKESCPKMASGKNTVVVISSDKMGEGDEELGKALMKAFIFALTQQEELPATILLYNGGAWMSVEDSPALSDLKALESLGVEILTCGTCLNHYGLTEKLAVGEVTNMYVIAETLMGADHVIKP